jgi:hypothetical protein
MPVRTPRRGSPRRGWSGSALSPLDELRRRSDFVITDLEPRGSKGSCPADYGPEPKSPCPMYLGSFSPFGSTATGEGGWPRTPPERLTSRLAEAWCDEALTLSQVPGTLRRMAPRKPKPEVVAFARCAPGFETVLADMEHLIEGARRAAARSVNAVMTATDWRVGRRIVEHEHEQHGVGRAAHGEEVRSAPAWGPRRKR